jgi:hypothetical protein
MYLDLVERILVSWSWIRWPRLMLCLAMANLSECTRWMCRWCSLTLVSMEQPVCPLVYFNMTIWWHIPEGCHLGRKLRSTRLV